MTIKFEKNQRRKPVQKRSIQKYNEILDASARVLTEVSYQDLTMQEISLESTHPYATIYQYFENKNAVCIAWLERFIDDSLAMLSQHILENLEDGNDRHVADSARIALNTTQKNLAVLRNLFDGMPMAITTLAVLLEDRATHWLDQSFGYSVQAANRTDTERRLLTTVRAGYGYWLQITLSAQTDIDVEDEAQNLAIVVKSLYPKEVEQQE